MDKAADNMALPTVESDSPRLVEEADESLVAAVCAGDDTAFEQIFERHRLRVVRIVGRFFNRPERVEEIAQEVFAKVFFALGDYRQQRGASFAAWLSRIAINSCYDELRRARRRPESPISSITDDEASLLNRRLSNAGAVSDAESAVISRDLADKLLARLGPDDRLILTLLAAEDLPVSEIAAVVGWSVSKVKVRAHRARQALRRVLDEFV